MNKTHNHFTFITTLLSPCWSKKCSDTQIKMWRIYWNFTELLKLRKAKMCIWMYTHQKTDKENIHTIWGHSPVKSNDKHSVATLLGTPVQLLSYAHMSATQKVRLGLGTRIWYSIQFYLYTAKSQKSPQGASYNTVKTERQKKERGLNVASFWCQTDCFEYFTNCWPLGEISSTIISAS